VRGVQQGFSVKWTVDMGLYKGKATFDDLVDLSLVEYAAQEVGKR